MGIPDSVHLYAFRFLKIEKISMAYFLFFRFENLPNFENSILLYMNTFLLYPLVETNWFYPLNCSRDSIVRDSYFYHDRET